MINNEVYRTLGRQWFEAEGDVIALLRLENQAKAPWVLEQLESHFTHSEGVRVLDAGCGGGYLTHLLQAKGYCCTGLDLSAEVLAVARQFDPTDRVVWRSGSVEALPFANGSFEAVCLMDVLEHISDPRRAIHQAIRVLVPNGLLLLHTFNRTWRSWLLADRALDWWIQDSPRNIHDWNLFIRPQELENWLLERQFVIQEIRGIGPDIWNPAFWSLVFKRRVPSDFRFRLGRGVKLGYLAACGLKGDC